ncbi:hypothetical protein D9M73_146260 [compost metagenome]
MRTCSIVAAMQILICVQTVQGSPIKFGWTTGVIAQSHTVGADVVGRYASLQVRQRVNLSLTASASGSSRVLGLKADSVGNPPRITAAAI